MDINEFVETSFHNHSSQLAMIFEMLGTPTGPDLESFDSDSVKLISSMKPRPPMVSSLSIYVCFGMC
jgi:hypothetical protein